MAKIIWISWEKHRRTENIVKKLGIKWYVFHSNKSRLLKHPFFLLKTFLTIHNEKPDFLIVQNPSLILSIFSVLLKFIYKYKLIVDSHNAGLYPYNNRLNFLLFFYRFIQKNSDITIVTNKKLFQLVKNNNGTPFILPDKIPDFTSVNKIRLSSSFNIVFISSFSIDEPYEQIIKTAEQLPESFHIYITGKYNIKNKIKYNDKVTYTGYLPEEDYVDLVFSADVTLCLTNMNDALLCGAYESVALGTPLITSDTEVIRDYFSKGIVYTKNDSNSILDAIFFAKNNIEKLKIETNILRSRLNNKWEIAFNKFLNLLNMIN